MKPLASIAVTILGIGSALAATDLWDLSPLRYSETASNDPIAKLAGELAKGERKVDGTTPLDKLRFVLRLHRVLESEPAEGNHPAIKASERLKIAAILQETLPAWSAK